MPLVVVAAESRPKAMVKMVEVVRRRRRMEVRATAEAAEESRHSAYRSLHNQSHIHNLRTLPQGRRHHNRHHYPTRDGQCMCSRKYTDPVAEMVVVAGPREAPVQATAVLERATAADFGAAAVN